MKKHYIIISTILLILLFSCSKDEKINGFNSEFDTLISLDGLESLQNTFKKENADIVVKNNDNLFDFCALNSIVSNQKYVIDINNNKYNPTTEDFDSGNCSIE